jgi:hypothetical protein
MSSFTQKLLRASLILPQGTFAGTNNNTLVLTGNRMSATLERAGNFTNTCNLQIFGMKQADMNAVSVIFWQGGNVQSINARAVLKLEANNGGGWLQIFEGQFQEGQPDYRAAPDVCLSLQASAGYGAQILSAAPSSTNGGADAATLAQQLATKMGFGFENNGVQATLQSPYLAGTLMEQFRDLADAAGFDYYFDAKSTLIICQRNQPRQNKTPAPVNAQTGMVGYPTIGRNGISVTVLFSPAIELGAPIKITGSQVPGADGLWFPYNSTDELESVKPNGRWFSTLLCSPASAYAST